MMSRSTCRRQGLLRTGRGSRLFLQRAQDALPGATIGIGPAKALLFGLDRATRGSTDHAVCATDIVAAGEQQGLQLTALIAADSGIVSAAL